MCDSFSPLKSRVDCPCKGLRRLFAEEPSLPGSLRSLQIVAGIEQLNNVGQYQDAAETLDRLFRYLAEMADNQGDSVLSVARFREFLSCVGNGPRN